MPKKSPQNNGKVWNPNAKNWTAIKKLKEDKKRNSCHKITQLAINKT